ncbi:hypothetical protein QCA50_008766 [Cerrena zonata]|uniref:Fungal-type protein kinase domain-containing protein n=1 Tax=Cerrena zonata TaxID=2478898 RepID=A0AAW0G4Z3_9APHY
MDHQHRQFLFSVLIMGDYARLLRFDPSCIAVSQVIPYRIDPRPLIDFILRYSTMSPVERGYDPTVSPACDAEKALFWERMKEYLEKVKGDNLRKHPDVETLGDNIVKIQVHDASGGIHSYLACKPPSAPINYSPCGRLSRGFIATPAPASVADKDEDTCETEQPELEKGKLFWLKDCWRSDVLEAEARVYAHLKANNVPNLPEIYYAGDVLIGADPQETLNDTLLSDPSTDSWRLPTGIINHMIHYRILQELLIPIDEVENVKELLYAGRDVMITLACAFHRAKLHHCDISKGNIMLPQTRRGDGSRGILIDWDHAKRIGLEAAGDSPILRSETWQFLSIQLLTDATKPHDIFDDIQSLFWSLLYVGVSCFKFTGNYKSRVFDEVFEEPHEILGKVPSGGQMKIAWLLSPPILFKCIPLESFFTTCRQFHRSYQEKLDAAIGSDTGKRELNVFIAAVEANVHALLVHFDTILDNPDINWSGQEANGISSKRRNATAEQRRIRESQASAIKNGIWRGGGKTQSRGDEQRVVNPPINDVKRGKERSRNSLEADDDESPHSKSAKVADDVEINGRKTRKVRVAHDDRIRTVTRPACDRVLRPRTRTC